MTTADVPRTIGAPISLRDHARAAASSTTGPKHPGAGIVHREEASSFEDWVGIAANRFVKLHVSSDDPQFRGTMQTVSVEEMLVSDIRASRHEVVRLARDISDDEPRHLKLSLQLEGEGDVEQDGRVAHLTPGDVAVYDTSRPYSLRYTSPLHSLVLIFPRQLIDLSNDIVSQATAMRLPGDEGIGTVISPFMRHIAANLDLLRGTSGVRIMHSALGLVTALLSSELAENDDVRDDTYRADMEKYRLYIEANLGDTNLSTETIARAHYLSTRYLQYLFAEDHTTVSDYIRQRRLERCRVSLRDPAQARSEE
ncbi:MAG: hypothetical protein ACTH31_11545, partial [Pseudoclavibacter sp.]